METGRDVLAIHPVRTEPRLPIECLLLLEADAIEPYFRMTLAHQQGGGGYGVRYTMDSGISEFSGGAAADPAVQDIDGYMQ